jgi:hypothetical protein
MGTGNLKRLAGSYAVAHPLRALPVCPALEGILGAPLIGVFEVSRELAVG